MQDACTYDPYIYLNGILLRWIVWLWIFSTFLEQIIQ